MHAHLAIVLPTTLVGDFTVRCLTRNPIVIAAPTTAVHGVDVAARWIGPPGCSLLGKGIRGISLIGVGRLGCIVVRVPGHALADAIDKQLVDLQTRRSCSLEDPVAIGSPLKLEVRAAAQYGPTLVRGNIGDGMIVRT